MSAEFVAIGLIFELLGLAVLAGDVLDTITEEMEKLRLRQERFVLALTRWSSGNSNEMSATSIIVGDTGAAPVRISGGDMGALKSVLQGLLDDARVDPDKLRQIAARKLGTWLGIGLFVLGSIFQALGTGVF